MESQILGVGGNNARVGKAMQSKGENSVTFSHEKGNAICEKSVKFWKIDREIQNLGGYIAATIVRAWMKHRDQERGGC